MGREYNFGGGWGMSLMGRNEQIFGWWGGDIPPVGETLIRCSLTVVQTSNEHY